MSTKKDLEEKNKALKDKIAELTTELGALKAKTTSAKTGDLKDVGVGIGIKEDKNIYMFTFGFNGDTGHCEITDEKSFGNSFNLAEHAMRDVIFKKIALPFARGEKK